MNGVPTQRRGERRPNKRRRGRTYPPSGSGYPPGQQPTTQFSAPTQQFGKVEQASQAQAPAAAAAGPSKLPVYLLAVVAVCGLLVYLFSFGPMFTISNTDFPQLGSASGTSLGLGLAVLASLLAALLAGASLLPKQKAIPAVVAAISVLAFLLVIAEIVNKPEQVSIDWALYVVIAFTFLQAAAAIAVLLLDAGIISAPAPRPKYEQQQQYGQYGGPGQYYGQHAPHQVGAPQHQQRPGYSSQYGGYSGGSASGGFSAIGQQGGPHAADRLPDLWPAAGIPLRANGQVPAQPQQSSSSNVRPRAVIIRASRA